MAQDSDNGVIGGLNTTMPIAMTIVAFSAIAWFNSIELNVLIAITFKRRRGLYFYSLLGASWGVIVYQLAFMAKFFQFWKNNYVSCAFITLGWYFMVTGQSLVLYSRLHLIMRDSRKLKWILYMIITDVFLFHIPTTVFTFGANSNQATKFAPMYEVMEKVQVTAFCIQEFIISSVYVYETRRILKPSEHFQKARTRRVMRHLIYINVMLILMDIALLCTEYANLYEIQISFKGALYSIKLRLEFAILNQLIAIASGELNHAASGASLRPDSQSRLATNPGPNTWIAHPGAQGLHLKAFDATSSLSRNGNTAIGLHTNPPANAKEGYVAFVGASSKSSPGEVEEGCVIKTTEVEIRGSSVSVVPTEEEDDPAIVELKESRLRY